MVLHTMILGTADNLQVAQVSDLCINSSKIILSFRFDKTLALKN